MPASSKRPMKLRQPIFLYKYNSASYLKNTLILNENERGMEL